MILKLYDPQIYPRKVWVCFDPDYKKLNKILETYPDRKEITEPTEDYGAYVQAVQHKKTKLVGILCTFASDLTPETAAHEAVHVADFIFQETDSFTQDYNESNHPYAYLVGWVVKCFYHARIKNSRPGKGTT